MENETMRHMPANCEYESVMTVIRAILPPESRTGRPRTPLDEILDAIKWIVETGAPWRDLPTRFPKWQTVYSFFRRLQKQNMAGAMLAVMAGSVGKEACLGGDVSLDASTMKAHIHAAGAPKPKTAEGGGTDGSSAAGEAVKAIEHVEPAMPDGAVKSIEHAKPARIDEAVKVIEPVGTAKPARKPKKAKGSTEAKEAAETTVATRPDEPVEIVERVEPARPDEPVGIVEHAEPAKPAKKPKKAKGSTEAKEAAESPEAASPDEAEWTVDPPVPFDCTIEPESHNLGRSRGGFTTRITAIVDNDTCAPVCIAFAPGNPHDSTLALDALRHVDITGLKIIMDRAYLTKPIHDYIDSHHATWLAPPKSNTVDPWEYDKEEYKRRNAVERFFGRIKQARRVATRYEKLAVCYEFVVVFYAFIAFCENY